MDDLTDDERAEMADLGTIPVMPAHPTDTPAPPDLPEEADPVEDAEAEPDGLEEIDPLGLGAMAEELVELEETPDGGPETYAEIRAKKKRRTAKVPLVLDTSARWDLINANAELKEAELALLADTDDVGRRKRVDDAMADVKAKEAKLETVTIVWEVQSINRKKIRHLIAACPPTPEQLSRHRSMKSSLGQAANEPLYDPDTFQPALVSACSIKPVLSIEDAVEMWEDDEWTEGELDALFNAAWILNQLPS